MEKGVLRIGGVLGGSLIYLATTQKKKISSFIFISEGFQYLSKDQEELRGWLETAQHGDLERDFYQNPDTHVTEVLTTYLGVPLPDRLIIHALNQPFHYDDGAQLVWGEEIMLVDDGNIEQRGDMHDALISAMEVIREFLSV